MPLCGLIPPSFIIWLFYTCGVGGEGLSDPPPAPELLQVNSGGSDVVVLRCQAPHGYRGSEYRLYRVQTFVDSVKFPTEQQFAEFQIQTVPVHNNYYCCRYGNSAYSNYFSPRPPLTPPHLSVTPSQGQIRPGQILSFNCQAPPTQHPVMFILQREVSGVFQEVMRSVTPTFSVEVRGWADGGMYTCMYQTHLSESSTPSLPVSITVAVDLPVPRLSREKEGALVCTGSPSYPGAHFSLFHQGSPSPMVTHHAPIMKHSAKFSVPTQTVEGISYQCGYSVLMGGSWTQSKRSASVFFSDEINHSHTESVDLALVVGSASAALLFLMMLIILGVGLHKHVNGKVQKRKQREQDQFWNQLHARDHVVDLSLERINIHPKNTGSDSGRCSTSEPIYDTPMTSFREC